MQMFVNQYQIVPKPQIFKIFFPQLGKIFQIFFFGFGLQEKKFFPTHLSSASLRDRRPFFAGGSHNGSGSFFSSHSAVMRIRGLSKSPSVRDQTILVIPCSTTLKVASQQVLPLTFWQVKRTFFLPCKTGPVCSDLGRWRWFRKPVRLPSSSLMPYQRTWSFFDRIPGSKLDCLSPNLQ